MRALLLLLCLLGGYVAQAGLVTRPTKTCGTTNYSTEDALGCSTILSDEVDDDLNAIYGEFNGNITDANVATGANISCTKIAAATCTNQLAPGSICTTEIGDGCIVNADIDAAAGIAGGKLAVGAATGQATTGATNSGTLSDNTTETTIVETPAFTSRGTTVIVNGQLTFRCDITIITAGIAGSASRTLTIREYACPGGVCAVAHTYGYSCFRAAQGPTTDNTQWPLSVGITFVHTPTAVAGTFYRITAQQGVATETDAQIEWVGGNGYLQQTELR